MIDSSTGMKPGERYAVESLERTRHFPGFFLDGKYYLGPELLTAVGWLEGQQFLYDELDPAGEPVFPDRVAGTIRDLTLTLADGARLKLNKVRYNAQVDLPTQGTDDRQVQHLTPTSRVEVGAVQHGPSRLLAVSAGLLVGYLIARRLGRR
nr:short chain dehydrogenase [Pseudomonas akapageensis]